MKLRAKVTALFAATSAVVLALVVTGLPSLFSRLIEDQMENHALTFAAFVGRDIEGLGLAPGAELGRIGDARLRGSIAAEFRDSAEIGMRTGGFMVESILLVDGSGSIVASYPRGREGEAAPEGETVVAAIRRFHTAPGPGVAERIVRGRGAMSVIAPIRWSTDRGLAVEVLLDFSKSMALHRPQFSAYELFAIAAAILVEFLQALALLGFIGRSAIAPAVLISEAMDAVAGGALDARVPPSSDDEFGDMARRFNDMARSLKEKAILSRYVSRATLNMVLNSTEGETALNRPVRKSRTILFSDIRGFTGFSERNEPELVVGTLNRIFEAQAAAILDWGGEIDKFVGDEIMASFEDSRRALLCALTIQRLVGVGREAFGGLRVGIGICAGPVVEGDVGIAAHKDFTLIGDAVNTAARLEGAAAPGEILVPSSILADPRMAIFVAGRKGAYQLKGKKYSLEVSSVTGVAKNAFRANATGANPALAPGSPPRGFPERLASPASPC